MEHTYTHTHIHTHTHKNTHIHTYTLCAYNLYIKTANIDTNTLI